MAMEMRWCIPNAHTCPILCIAYNNDRSEIYSGSQDAQIKVWDVQSGKQLRVQQGHQAWVMDLLYCSVASLLFSCSLDGNIFVWSDKGKLLQMVDFGGPIYCLAWDTKGKNLIAGGRAVVQIFRCIRSSSGLYLKSDSQNQKIGTAKFLLHNMLLLEHRDVVQGICCSEFGNVFTTGFDKSICIFDSSKPVDTMRKLTNSHEAAISAAAYDKNCKCLVTGSYDGSVKIWSHEGHCLDTFRNVTDCVTSIACIPHTNSYWVTGRARYPVIIDALASADVTEWVADTCSFRKLPLNKVFHSSESDVTIGSTLNHDIIVWRYNCFGPHRVLCGHTDWWKSVAVAYRRLPSIEEDIFESAYKPHTHLNSIMDLQERKEELAENEDGDAQINTQDSGPIDIEVFTGGSQGSVLKWQTDRSSSSWSLSDLAQPPHNSILCMLHHASLDLLVAGSEDCKIRVWSLDSLSSVSKWKAALGASRGPEIFQGHTDKVTGLAACKNEILVSGSDDKSLRWWDLNSRMLVDTIERAHDLPIQGLDYCESKDELASCASEPGFKLWNATKKKLLHSVKSSLGDIWMIKWLTMDGGCWITASEDGTIAMWDPQSHSPLRSICHGKDPLTALVVDETNRLILTSTQSDYTIRGYKLDLVGGEVCTYVGHSSQVRSLVYLPKRNQYLSGSWDKTVRIWLAPKQDGGDATTKSFSSSKPEVKEEKGGAMEFSTEERYISNFEKEHPLVAPKQLQEAAPSTRDHKRSRAAKDLISGLLPSSSTQTNVNHESHNKLTKMSPLAVKLEELEKSLNDKI